LGDERVSPRDVVVLEAKVGGEATPDVRGIAVSGKRSVSSRPSKARYRPGGTSSARIALLRERGVACPRQLRHLEGDAVIVFLEAAKPVALGRFVRVVTSVRKKLRNVGPRFLSVYVDLTST
jgi:hypothetical protein